MKKYLKMTIITIILLMLATTTVSATYQSKAGQDSLEVIPVDSFFYGIRRMEADGQVLGLKETLKTDDSGEAETDSNNLDCHMIKNTEYGIVALFTASSFGNITQGYGTTQNGPSTTQNETGIYQMINYNSSSGGNEKREYVAAVYSNIGTGTNSEKCGKLRNSVNKKYVDIYESTSITGDAIRETQNWHGAPTANFVLSAHPVFIRGYNGMFSYSRSTGGDRLSSRAVVVCGQGL